ncbi:hypothetical protein P6166_06035 [Stenotrophomonas sp. HITSZ_GD]|uniref:hypothetical protein n=1 Tax=Stenotrophomonas sp. HITSZ_GD TaxID=3037248 RepID=UPI00240D02AB|nr:hypothetical protein [Stenotrophomonas sp. HITSZ_GD]MDG2524910.1 hypothetical protein [Stenotrophomonas sp. HITSZ_GD]
MALAMVAIGVAGAAAASDEAAKLVVHPGGEHCATQELAALGQASLCVKGGSFSHDVYTLKIAREVVLSGIDDDTTRGLETDSEGRHLRLVCAPRLEPNDTMKGVVKRMLLTQGKSEEEAETLAQRMGVVEAGRVCTLAADGTAVWQVEVVFP